MDRLLCARVYAGHFITVAGSESYFQLHFIDRVSLEIQKFAQVHAVSKGPNKAWSPGPPELKPTPLSTLHQCSVKTLPLALSEFGKILPSLVGTLVPFTPPRSRYPPKPHGAGDGPHFRPALTRDTAHDPELVRQPS